MSFIIKHPVVTELFAVTPNMFEIESIIGEQMPRSTNINMYFFINFLHGYSIFIRFLLLNIISKLCDKLKAVLVLIPQ